MSALPLTARCAGGTMHAAMPSTPDPDYLQLNTREHDGGVSFALRVQPRAKRSAIVGLHGDALKVALTAAPVDGAANSALLALLAAALAVPGRTLRLLHGERSRSKTVHVAGLDAATLRARLAALGG